MGGKIFCRSKFPRLINKDSKITVKLRTMLTYSYKENKTSLSPPSNFTRNSCAVLCCAVQRDSFHSSQTTNRKTVTKSRRQKLTAIHAEVGGRKRKKKKIVKKQTEKKLEFFQGETHAHEHVRVCPRSTPGLVVYFSSLAALRCEAGRGCVSLWLRFVFFFFLF